MIKNSFNDISIRGRIAFCIMAVENYTSFTYPDVDFSAISKLMWNIVGDTDFIDNSAYRYMEIIPEYLYEFDSFADSDFEYISESEYEAYKRILPKSDEALNQIMHRIYDIAMEYAYEAIPVPGKKTIDYLFDVIKTLEERCIPIPDISSVSSSTFDQHDGWGDFISYKGLSRYL